VGQSGGMMLLHKSAFRILLSQSEENALMVWKERIRKAIGDPCLQNAFQFLLGELRASYSFKHGFMTCHDGDLGHYAAQISIRMNNIPVLCFLIQHNFMMLRQGTIVMPLVLNKKSGFTANVFEDDEPYMYTALVYGSCQSVTTLLENGVSATGCCQNTTFLSLALQEMCCREHTDKAAVEKVEILLQHGANPLLPDSHGMTSLVVLCDYMSAVSADSVRMGSLDQQQRFASEKHHWKYILNLIISKIPIASLTLNDMHVWSTHTNINPLQTPAEKGNTWLIRLLLKRGVDINSVNREGQTALFANSRSLRLKRASRNVMCDYRYRRFSIASTQCLEPPLTKHNVRPQHIDSQRGSCSKKNRPLLFTTPLHTLRFLVTHGIRVSHIDAHGCTPITHLLKKHPNSDMLYEKIFFFLECGVSAEHVCQQGNTALSLAQQLVLSNPKKFTLIVSLMESMIPQPRTVPCMQVSTEHIPPASLPPYSQPAF